MRLIFGLISLIIVVAVVGILTKQQLAAVPHLPTNPTASNQPAANVAEQSQQIQQQVKDQIGQSQEAAAARLKDIDK